MLNHRVTNPLSMFLLEIPAVFIILVIVLKTSMFQPRISHSNIKSLAADRRARTPSKTAKEQQKKTDVDMSIQQTALRRRHPLSTDGKINLFTAVEKAPFMFYKHAIFMFSHFNE